MARKYLRGLQYETGTNGRDIPIFMRVCYEFWAYCINTNPILEISNATNAAPIQITTTTPHGLVTNQLVGISGVGGNTAANGQFIVTVTNATQFTLNSSTGNGTYTSGGRVCVPGGMPISPVSGASGFFEGTTSVIATGTDGVTSDLGINFTSLSANFSPSLIGKHITIWSATDPDSTDNSIYRIVNVPSSTQLMLYPFSGGTKDITTLKNNLTSRSALNYRVIDLIATSQLSVTAGNYFVGTFTEASLINTGQASSQFRFYLRGSANAYGNFGMEGSPGGTWTGSAFTGSVITERSNQVSVSFTGTSSGINGNITLIGDKNFFMGHVKSINSNGTNDEGMYFYVLVPQRLYTQAQDPNPLAILVGANNLNCNTSADSHSTYFYMVHNDGTSRAMQLITKNFVGDGTVGTVYTIGPNLTPALNFKTRTGRIIYTEALMASNSAVNQFSLARAKMIPIAFTGNNIPSYHLVGDNGEFIHIVNGILWPWDGSIMPNNLLPQGT